MTNSGTGVPTAYITYGGAGSGKSTLSKHLSSLTGAAYLDKDAIAGALVKVALEALGQDPSDRESNDLYLTKIMPAEYETLFEAASQNLQLGNSVVIDAPFVAYLEDPDFLGRSIAKASWPVARIRVIHVRASAEVVQQRLVERGNSRDYAKLSDWDNYWNRFGGLESRWNIGDHVDVVNDDESAFLRLAELVN